MSSISNIRTKIIPDAVADVMTEGRQNPLGVVFLLTPDNRIVSWEEDPKDPSLARGQLMKFAEVAVFYLVTLTGVLELDKLGPVERELRNNVNSRNYLIDALGHAVGFMEFERTRWRERNPKRSFDLYIPSVSDAFKTGADRRTFDAVYGEVLKDPAVEEAFRALANAANAANNATECGKRSADGARKEGASSFDDPDLAEQQPDATVDAPSAAEHEAPVPNYSPPPIVPNPTPFHPVPNYSPLGPADDGDEIVNGTPPSDDEAPAPVFLWGCDDTGNTISASTLGRCRVVVLCGMEIAVTRTHDGHLVMPSEELLSGLRASVDGEEVVITRDNYRDYVFRAGDSFGALGDTFVFSATPPSPVQYKRARR